MSELTNQECRDLKGSLSNRGCYFDKDGKPTVSINKAESFSCLDCNRSLPISRAFHILKYVPEGGKIARPLCSPCKVAREREDA